MTATGRSEVKYQEERAKRAPKPITGPAGIAIPHPASVYRKTMDGPLLSAIVAAATKAYRIEQLPQALAQAAGQEIVEDLRRRYPPADMAVLDRFGFALTIERVWVDYRPSIFKMEAVELPAVVAVPTKRDGYVVVLPGEAEREGDAAAAPPPEHALPYFLRVIDVRETIRQHFKPAIGEPGQFANREKRQPTWGEIEAAWPRVGAWMRYQREPQW